MTEITDNMINEGCVALSKNRERPTALVVKAILEAALAVQPSQEMWAVKMPGKNGIILPWTVQANEHDGMEAYCYQTGYRDIEEGYSAIPILVIPRGET